MIRLTASGGETVLHEFANNGDGRNPSAGLVLLNGVLYGTATSGPSSHPYGTVFALTP